MSHSHVDSRSEYDSRLLTALGLTVIILAVEAAVGFASNSLALISDAGHILTDVFALGLAWFALRRSRRPADERHTFGYRRSGILAALANSIILIIIAVVIGFEAFGRIEHAQSVNGLPVVFAAALAAVVNLCIARTLRPHSHGDVNVRAALLHVAGDIAASLAVVVSAVIILVTHAYVVDPILSWVIAGLIAVGAWRIVTQTTGILMEAAPPGVDLAEVSRAMHEVPGVEDVHDLHVWSLADGYSLLSAHLTIPDQTLSSASILMSDVRFLLAKRFNIGHTTIEIECANCSLPVVRPITMHDPEVVASRGSGLPPKG